MWGTWQVRRAFADCLVVRQFAGVATGTSTTLAQHGYQGQKSLAPYRDCLGREGTGTLRCPGRGSFDRGDLKEAAGAAGRAMEPQGCFGVVETGDVSRYVRKKAKRAVLDKAGVCW